MKKPRPQRTTKPPSKTAADASPQRLWLPAAWQWIAALAALILAFEVYGPAIRGPFVFDDRYLPFFSPHFVTAPLSEWLAGLRPVLMFSFWIDHSFSGSEPASYHVTNVALHFLNAVLVALICARFLQWASVAGGSRAALSVFGGALFLLHPLQTESVAYVASRSEELRGLFCLAALAVFIYRRTGGITWPRALAACALLAAASLTKEDAPAFAGFILLTDFFWNRAGVLKNWRIYALFGAALPFGAIYVWRLLKGANTAGFGMGDLGPATYFFTECRVLWIYLRMCVLPFGQNIDPDIPLSHSILDHGALFGLLGLIGLGAAAWFGRKRFPLASFGVLAFLYLIAPTSSFIPIRDPLAEHRLYLPLLGFVLIALEFLRRLNFSQIVWAGAMICAACAVLCYQRSEVWTSSLALWQDSVAKSPNKYRPRFQYAYALLYDANKPAEAAENYEIASRLGPVDHELLVNWALALDKAGRENEALEKLEEALALRPSAHVFATIGMIYAKQSKTQQALDALTHAEQINPRFEWTYVYRGKIYQMQGDNAAAASEFKKALAINPANEQARDALVQVSQ